MLTEAIAIVRPLTLGEHVITPVSFNSVLDKESKKFVRMSYQTDGSLVIRNKALYPFELNLLAQGVADQLGMPATEDATALLNGLETNHTPFKVWLVQKIEKGVAYTNWYYSRPIAPPSITTAAPTADADGVVDEM